LKQSFIHLTLLSKYFTSSNKNQLNMATKKKQGRSSSKASASKKKAAPKKVSRKKSAVRKKAAKAKSAPRKAAPKKAAKKSAAKKSVAKKSTGRSGTNRRGTAAKKAAPKKAAGKKSATKKAPPKKSAPNKSVRRGVTTGRGKGVTSRSGRRNENAASPAATDQTVNTKVPEETIDSVENDTDGNIRDMPEKDDNKADSEGVLM
jgi:hypothetical protein